ncbi:MAG: hypothetical protein JO276_17475 [Sphingomonadaceae bacterium]|nr:hypothetical protein [Sphingomonadaceae bacterium]
MPRSLDLTALAAVMAATPMALCARAPATVAPSALAQAALVCRGIPDETGAAERRIAELGWPRAGSGRDAQLPMFERNGIVVMVIPPDAEGHPLSCGVMATVGRSTSPADLTAAVSAAFGRQPGSGEAAGAPVWELEAGQVVAVARDDEGGVLFTFWYPRAAAH